MATGKSIQNTVKTDFQQVGAEGLQNALKSILMRIQSIPAETKKVNPAINQLGQDLNKLAQTFAKGNIGSDEWITALKEVQKQIKTIQTLTSGLHLFEKDDLARLKEFGREQSRIQKQQQEEAARYANLQAADRAREKRELEAIVRLRQKQANPPEADVLLGRNTTRDMSGRSVVNPNYLDRDGWKAFSAQMRANMVEEQKLADLQVRQARDNQNRIQEARNPKGDAARSANVFKENFAAQDAAAAEQKRIQRQVEDERNYQANLKARHDAEQNKPSQVQRNLQSRAALSTGEGAASLLLIQGALMANATLLNGVIGGIRETIQFSVQLEAAFRNVQAVVGTTSKEMVGLENTIKQVSTTTKFSANEVAEAALTLGQAGLSSKQISESLMSVVTLANAAGSSIANAVDLVTSVIGVFDKNSNDVADVANKITQAANGSKVSVEKLALGFQYAGNTAAQLGISFEEVTAAMAAMSNAGIKSGSTMGTGLRQFLTEVQKPSENFLTILSRLGLSISDLDFRSKGFIGVIKTLKESGFVASDAIQSFDVRGAAAFNALLARPDDLQGQYDSLNGSQAAMKANEIQMNSLSAQSSRLTNVLGILASTGFEPVMQALTGMLKLVGDALARLTEFQGLLQVVGTVMAGLAAAAITAWIVPLVKGLGLVLGMLPGVISGATALGAAFTTLGVISGVGVAVAAAVGAFQLFKYVTGETARNLDEAAAALERAKGAATEKGEVVTSLTKRIELLSSREQELKNDTSAWASEIDQINNQISRWGFTTDGATASLDSLLVRLRMVRQEMRQMQLADMRNVAAKAGEVASLELKNQDEKLGKARSALNTSTALGGFPGQRDFMKSLTPEQRSFFEAGQQKIKSGDQQFLGSGGVSQMQTMMQTWRAQNKDVARQEGIPGVTSFDQVTAALGALGASAADARNAERGAVSARRDVTEFEGMNSLRDRLRGQGVDLDSLTKGNVAARAKAALPEADKGDLVKINALTRQMTDELRNQLEQQKKVSLTMAKTADERTNIETLFRQAEESMSESLRQSAPGAVAQVSRETKRSGDESELTRLRKNLSSKGGGTPEQLSRASELVRNINEREFIKTTAGMNKDDYDATRVETNRKIEEQIGALTDTANRAGASAAASALKSQESSYRAVAEAKMKDAKSQRGRANSNMGMEDISKLMDTGLEKIAEAKKIEMDSIVRQYGTGSIEGKNLTEAAGEKYNAAAQTFIGSFSGLIETVTDRTLGISKFVKATEAKIKKMFNDFENTRFDQMGDIRANDREQAINAGPVSGRRRSEVDVYNTTRAREPLDLARAQADLLAKQEQRATIEMDRMKASRMAADAGAKLATLNASQSSLLKGRSLSDLTNPAEQKLGVQNASQIAEYEKGLTAAAKSTEDLTDKSQKLRDEIENLGNKVAGLTELTPKPDDWDTLAESMEKVWTAYGDIIARADIFAPLESGMLSAFKGIQGSMATFFTEAVSGTKSVGDAFKGMAVSIIKSMMDVIAQALAMQALKSILGAFGMGGGAVGGGISGQSLSFGSTGFGAGALMPAAASGGLVTGGIPGKDSVPVMTMPGEYILKKKAVDALGANYVANLNNANSATITASTPSSVMPSGSSGGEPVRPINIWVVTPDQQPAPGPDDVVAAVSDNISRGGSLKQLIKSI